MKKNVVVFCGSQEIQDLDTANELKFQFNEFLHQNKDKINTVLFGGQNHGVMWMVYESAKQNNVPVKGYSTEEYRKWDEWNGVDIDFFEDDQQRTIAFQKAWDIFLVLSGWEWTTREAWYISDKMDSDNWEFIYISALFKEYINFLNALDQSWMRAKRDIKVKKIIDDISTIRI